MKIQIDGKRGTELFSAAEKHEEDGNLREAFKCLLEAARIGYPMAQISLGNFFATGKGTKPDKRAAEQWYMKAFRQGYRDAAFNLAVDRRNQGRLRSASIWFKKALALNDGEACIELARLKLDAGRKSEASALLRRAASMTPSDISDESRDEAKRLLHQVTS